MAPFLPEVVPILGTKPGSLLRAAIPTRTYADWDQPRGRYSRAVVRAVSRVGAERP